MRDIRRIGTLMGRTYLGVGAIVVMAISLASESSCARSVAPSDEPRASVVPRVVHNTSSPEEDARVQAWLSDRYLPSDVRHSYEAKPGVTIDCVNFFAYPSVKNLAKAGKPLTKIPTPPPLPPQQGVTPSSFSPGIDKNGSVQACAGETVGIRRVTREDIAAAGGLDAFTHRAAMPLVHPPRPRPGAKDASPGPANALTTSTNARTGTPAIPNRLEAEASPLVVPAPDAGDEPYCTEFELSDIPGFAHVQATEYPAGDTTIFGATATMSITKTSLNSTQLGYEDHNITQTWLYSGWAFESASTPACSCGRTDPNRPCAQTIEIGAINIDFDGPSNTETLSVAGTNDGYNLQCFANSLKTPCDGTLYDVNGVQSPIWVPQVGSNMMAQESLDMYGGGGYELYTLDEFQTVDGVSGWWIAAGINKVTSTSTTVVVPTSWLGYFEASNFSGFMAEGEAQTYQAGGEVYDKAEITSGTWSIDMGSGENPAGGFPAAAYVHDMYSAIFAAMGPVTVPSSYTYSNTAAPANSSWGSPAGADEYFYFGGPGDRDNYSWTAYLTPDPSTIPTLWAPSPTVGAITIAPVYIYDSSEQESKLHIFILTPSVGGGGNNRLVKTYSSLSNAWTTVTDNNGDDVYVWGITTDHSNGQFWGWTHSTSTTGGAIFTNDPSGAPTQQTGWPGFTSIAANSPSQVYATNLSDVGGASSEIEYGYMPGGHWTNGGVLGIQATVDSITGQLYELQSGGGMVVSYLDSSTGIPTTKCSSGTFTATQIAAKNGVIYGLGGAGGVWYYTAAKNCWTQIGTKSFSSIATDNGDFNVVWAVDTSGAIWTAD